MNDGLHRLVAPLGRRLLARSRRVVGASGLTLARAVRERRRPKLLGDSTRLAVGRSLARRRAERPVLSVERPPDISDFAAEVLFGTEPPAGTPFEEALPFLEEQFSPPAPSDEPQLAAPRAAREHVTQPLPRGRVHEAGRFKLSRHPAQAASSEPLDESDGETVVDEVVEQPASPPEPEEVPFAEEDAPPTERGVIASTEAAPAAKPADEAVPVPTTTGAASTPVPPPERGRRADAPASPRPLVVARKRTAPAPERPLLRMRRIEPRAPTPVEALRPESPQPPPTIAQRLLRFFRPSPDEPAREERAPAPEATVQAAPLVVARTPPEETESEATARTPGLAAEPTVEAEPLLQAASEPSPGRVLRRVRTFLGRSPEPLTTTRRPPAVETRAAPQAPLVEQPPEPVSELEVPTPAPAPLAVSQSQQQPEVDAEQEPTPASALADEEEEEERAVVLQSRAEETFSEPERLEAETQLPSATPVARLLTRVRRAGRTVAARQPVASPPAPEPPGVVRPAQLPQPQPLSGSRARARLEPDSPGFVESEPPPERAVLRLEAVAPAPEHVEEPEPVHAPVQLRSVTTRPATRRTISRQHLPVRQPQPTLWERAEASGVAATHEPSGVTTVMFPPPPQAALATTEHELVAREPAAVPELPVSTPAPTAAAAPGPAAPASPGGGDFDELYERVVDRLRRDLLADRERVGDLIGDGP